MEINTFCNCWTYVTPLQKLKHKNIVELRGLVDSDQEDMYMVMEYLPMGSLKDYVKINKEHVLDTTLLKYAMDIAEVRYVTRTIVPCLTCGGRMGNNTVLGHVKITTL